jgi:hypothetical protein
MKRPPFCFLQAVFPLSKIEISFEFSRRKFAKSNFPASSFQGLLGLNPGDWSIIRPLVE